MFSISLCLLCSLHYILALEAPVTDEPAVKNATAQRLSPFFIHDDHYALSTYAKINWYQAQATCAAHGLTLVSITTKLDDQRLRTFLNVKARDLLNTLDDYLWTSGTDLAGGNRWTWFSNGQYFSYSNFKTGAPTNRTINANCVSFNAVTGLWQNSNCLDKRLFVCEIRCPILDKPNNNYFE